MCYLKTDVFFHYRKLEMFVLDPFRLQPILKLINRLSHRPRFVTSVNVDKIFNVQAEILL